MSDNAHAHEKTKRLSELGLTPSRGQGVEVTGLAVDSRQVKTGYLFAALPGSTVHGAEFISYALRMDAGAILTDRDGAQIAQDVLTGSDVALIIAENPREALAHAAALWYEVQPEVCVAVTGTNGKTSVSAFCQQIWTLLDLPAVNMGTTGVEGAWTYPLNHTTPEPITLHKVMAMAAKNGVTHMAMEASSHGLDQHRLDGVQLCAAGFTNFSQDHLDYHQTFDAYFAAKMRLFTHVLPPEMPAVINVDDNKGPEATNIARDFSHPVLTVGELRDTALRRVNILTVGQRDGVGLRILNRRYSPTGQSVLYEYEGNRHQTELNLIGGFQADNVALAVGLVIAAGSDAERAFNVLPKLTTVHGRMELAGQRENGAAVFVDYAHTPGAIATAIHALRPHVMGRIIAIVGAGGDRDRAKRPLMGAAAAIHADIVIVTDDNPRGEAPEDIRKAVIEGATTEINSEYLSEVGDRAEAILRGVDALQPGDALLICGKGHETGQVVGDVVYPFDDVEQASVAIAALEGKL